MAHKETIGFIGQGFIGAHMADDMEERGYSVVRYAKEAPYDANQHTLTQCDIVFVAVPTPTTPDGFDDSILREVLALPRDGAIVVIKSTVTPGTTSRLQKEFPGLCLLHAPEFLREKHAATDTKKPERTIIGMPVADTAHQEAVQRVVAVLPAAPYECVCSSEEAELIKYGGNGMLALKVVYMNVLYDLTQSLGASYDVVAAAMSADPRIGSSHMQVLDSSGHQGAKVGRGAGGHCFPKDWAALRESYEEHCRGDTPGIAMLRAVENKNVSLLRESGKDLDLLAGIYGE